MADQCCSRREYVVQEWTESRPHLFRSRGFVNLLGEGGACVFAASVDGANDVDTWAMEIPKLSKPGEEANPIYYFLLKN